MRRELVLPAALYHELATHLDTGVGEQGAFIYGGVSQSRQRLAILARRWSPFLPEHVVGETRYGIELRQEAKVSLLLAARGDELAIADVHSHPGVDTQVSFSEQDRGNLKDFAPYVQRKLPGRPFVSIVWGSSSVDAQMWDPDGSGPHCIDLVRVVGSEYVTLVPTSAAAATPTPIVDRRYDRNVLAFGEAGQRRISALRVGIIGLGGIGSHVAQLLAYLGVRHFVLVDPDRVARSNLNRLIGAMPEDARLRRRKVHVTARLIRSIQPDAAVRVIAASIRDAGAIEAVKDVDVIFGCVDRDSGRLILSELAAAYLIPYLDLATEVIPGGFGLNQTGGRIITVVFGRACLACAGEIDFQAAAEELESKPERELRRRHGYIRGHRVHAPSVVALNGVVANLAVMEFVGLITGFRAVGDSLVFYAMDAKARPRHIPRADGCVICALHGLGDLAEIAEKYRTLSRLAS